MGVKGLSSFVKANPSLLTDCELRDCGLVIDGKNLYHFIYHSFESGLNHQNGGDYDRLSDHIKLFFNQLLSCDISPFLVFDGGYEPDERKLKTTYKRLEEGVERAGKVSQGKDARVLPLLAHETFVHTLDSLGIPHVTCDGEADREIAALANHWECQVLSNDSDFFIFPLDSGFVLLDTLNFTNKGDVTFVEGKCFYQKTMLEHIKCQDSKILPLFATLQGNDFVDPNIFKPLSKIINQQISTNYQGNDFIDPVNIRHFVRFNKYKKRKEIQTYTTCFKNISNCIKWLAGQDSTKSAIDVILHYFRKYPKANIKQVIEESMESYCNLTSSIVLEFKYGVPTSCNLMSYIGKSLPNWFCDMVRKGTISTKLLDAVRLHRVFNKCQVENTSGPSSYQCSLPLRKIIYGVLFSLEDLPMAATDHSKCNFVVEYGRDIHSIGSSEAFADYNFGKGSINFDRFSSIEERRRFIIKCVNVAQIDIEQNSDIVLPLLAVIYWANNTSTINGLHVIVIVACAIQLSGRSSSVTEKCGPCMDLMEKYFHPQTYNRKNKLDCRIAHAFAQYQTCFQALLHLNNLLLCPFMDISPSATFNGTFTYNLLQDLQYRMDPLQHIYALLGKSFEIAYHFVRKQIPQRFRLLPTLLTRKEKNRRSHFPYDVHVVQRPRKKGKRRKEFNDL